jgi:zinc protease
LDRSLSGDLSSTVVGLSNIPRDDADPTNPNLNENRSVLKNVTSAVLAVAALMALVMSPGHSDTTGGSSRVSHFTLANGLEVVVIPDHRAPVVTHMIWYKVGAADEPPGKSGIAHFLEHLMFKGTAKNPAGRFSQMLATIGGQENAFTSNDYTGYFQRVAKEHLPAVMEFEADRMTGLVLTEDVVKPELNVVLEEQNQRVANSPAARLGEDIQAALYLNHPYGKPVIGWRHEIEKLTREDALEFYRRFYTPNNAVLVIAGDVQAAEVQALAEQTYGKVERRSETGPRQRPQEPEQRVIRTVTLADAQVVQPSLTRNYLVPSAATAKPGESEALDVLAHVLGNSSTGRLYRILVVEKSLATSASGFYTSSALDQSRFGVSGTPAQGVTLLQLDDAIDGVIAELIEKGVAAEDIERSKTRLIADAIYALDNQATMARWYGVALTTGSSIKDVQSWADRIKSVTAEQVREAARMWLDKRRSVTGYLVKDSSRREDKRS